MTNAVPAQHEAPSLVGRKPAMSERAGSTVAEAPGSHPIYVSQPAAVADVIKEAARSSLRETTPAL